MATGRIGVTPTLGTRWSKAPSAGTTSLSGLDDNSVSLVYSVGYEAVYRNGVLLSRTNDYTATNGTTITLIDATIAGDIIEVFANQLVPLSDAISKGQFTAKGSLLSATAASTPAVLAVGSNDQVLTADSSTSTGLKWATAASGGMTEIASGSLGTGATFTISAIPGTYKNLQLVIDDFYPATSNVDFALQFNGITTAKYSAFWVGYNSGIANSSLRQNDSMNFDVDVPNNFTNSKIIINLWDYASTNDIKTLQGSYAWQESNGDNPRMVQLAGSWYQATAGAITSITVLCGNNASGFNIGGGTYKLFGVK